MSRVWTGNEKRDLQFLSPISRSCASLATQFLSPPHFSGSTEICWNLFSSLQNTCHQHCLLLLRCFLPSKHLPSFSQPPHPPGAPEGWWLFLISPNWAWSLLQCRWGSFPVHVNLPRENFICLSHFNVLKIPSSTFSKPPLQWRAWWGGWKYMGEMSISGGADRDAAAWHSCAKGPKLVSLSHHWRHISVKISLLSALWRTFYKIPSKISVEKALGGPMLRATPVIRSFSGLCPVLSVSKNGETMTPLGSVFQAGGPVQQKQASPFPRTFNTCPPWAWCHWKDWEKERLQLSLGFLLHALASSVVIQCCYQVLLIH